MNTYLKYQPSGIHLLAFLAFAGGCFLLSSIVSYFYFQDVYAIMLDKTATISPEIITKFKLAQLFSAILSFLLPALLFGYYSSPKSLPYIGLQPHLSISIMLAVMLLFIFIQPFIGYIGYVNSHLHFGSLQKYIDQTEGRYERALKIFLQMPSLNDFFINLFIMALLPAVCEELFFRGALQKVLIRFSKIPWLGILVSAIVFALLHGTMLKIIPIFFLGLLLGTVYYFTRNLWYTITIHFINNGMALMAVYFGEKSELLKKMSDDNYMPPLYMAVAGLGISLLMLNIIRKKSNEVFPKFMSDEDNDYIAR